MPDYGEQLYYGLLSQGLSPEQAWAIARRPSYPETATQNPADTWTGYRGWQDENRAGRTQPESREQRMQGVQGGAAAAQARRERPINYQPGGGAMPIPQETMDLVLSSPKYQALLQSGVPPSVALSIMTQPSYGEGEMRAPQDSYATPFRGQGPDSGVGQPSDLSPWLDIMRGRITSSGPQNIASGSQMSPQDAARLRLMMQILGARGTGGMQQNPLGGTQQPGGGFAGQLAQGGGMSPQLMQLLQYYLQQQSGPGSFPQGGGGVTLADLLRTPGTQMAGSLLGRGQDQSDVQRTTPTPPWPRNAPYPWDMFSGPRGGPPVDYSYPPARRMVPANDARLYSPSYG